MGQRWRHYKTLMRKNYIIWKRTWVSSLLELVCPIALMAVLCLTRLAVKREHISESTMLQYGKMFVPIAGYQQGPQNTEAQKEQAKQLASFLEFGQMEYMTSQAVSNFFPANCQLRAGVTGSVQRPIIAFSSDNDITQSVVAQLKVLGQQQKQQWNQRNSSDSKPNFEPFIPYKFKQFKNQQELIKYIKDPQYMKNAKNLGICFGFEVTEHSLSDYDVKLFFDDRDEIQANQGIPLQLYKSYDIYNADYNVTNFIQYTGQGFSYLQNWIANEILRKATKNSSSTIAMQIFPMKRAANYNDDFNSILKILLPFFMLLIYVLPIYRMISRIVAEKESKVRDNMKIMGLTQFSYWMSWFTYYIILVTVISSCLLGIVQINVIRNSSRLLIFLYFWIYGMSLFGLIIFFQSVFNKAMHAAIIGTLIYFGSAFIDFAVGNMSISPGVKYGLSLLPPVAVLRGANNIASFEVSGIGLNFNNFNDDYQNYKLSVCFIMQAVSFFAFISIGIYLDQVLPGDNGVKLPFYFFLMPSYWLGARNKQRVVLPPPPPSQGKSDKDQESYEFETKYLCKDNYEPVHYDLEKQEINNKILKIQDLKKVYPNGFRAVSGLNVKMYSGQIFALLGHNGAGKSTTISMLTGLIQSSNGIAEIFGHNLFNDMATVRQFMGVCPQHDVLFDLLTPIEHLQIYCDFKNVCHDTQQADIQRMLKDIDLLAHKDTIAKNLSGGNKRKLSVGIALIGDSKLVLLDEPTAGMDLTARRKLWDMLKSYKQNRIIILTTHYMDEADILGDRIGIMSDGKLVCLGSSLFLKNRFGVGYNITMIKEGKEAHSKLESYLEENIGQVMKLHETQSEITYQIPTHLSFKFQGFFEKFDKESSKLLIKSYGISITTLEDVFLNVRNLGSIDQSNSTAPTTEIQREIKAIERKTSTGSDTNLQKSSEAELEDFCISEYTQHIKGMFFIHLLAVFRKRYYNYRRNFKSLLVEIFIPVVLVIIGFSFSKLQFFYNSPDRVLTPRLYPSRQELLINRNFNYKQNGSNISPQQLISSLPNFNQIFQAHYNDYSQLQNKEILPKYDQDLFSQKQTLPNQSSKYGSYFIYEANNDTKQFKVSSFINLTSQDSTALFPQFMYEAILKQATGNPNFRIKLTNSPFPVPLQLKQTASNINGVFIVFALSIGFALIPTSIISYILNERENNLKHMQLISGMNLSAYWISNFIFDMAKAYIPVIITIGLLYAFNLHYDDVWTVLLMYPIGIIPFTYVTSFLFVNENMAQTATIFLHFVFSGIGAIIVFVLRIADSTHTIGDNFLWIFKLIPSFCLTNSIMFVSSKIKFKLKRPDLDLDNFNIQNIGGDLLFLAIHFIFWTIFLVLIECGIARWILQIILSTKSDTQSRTNIQLDEDVLNEEKRVEETDKDNMRIRVNKFKKVYNTGFRKSFCAVERTSFGLDYGECFALLGANGAGKSTTFKSLTNDIAASQGDITINGMDVRRNFAEVRKQIGYCPQKDALFNLMTVEEHLDYYASIKGLVGEKKQQIIEKQIMDLDLAIHRQKPAGTLSGGNKRKLSVAIAVLGNPPIILLDEPSAGMDPEARRFMWSVVAKISQKRKKSAVILTTHSMEEAEALSTKMGIMVKGGLFRCFGSSQHIKNKFGTGYEIEVKIRKLNPDQIKQKIIEYQVTQETESILLSKCLQFIRKQGADEFLIGEIRQDGLGSDIYNEAQNQNGMVNLNNFIIWLNLQLHGQTIIKSLVENFYQVEMLEQYNGYYKIRVPRQDKSIGYVFGMIEAHKEEYGISEYSVSQTTLEQIFQTFAQMEIDSQQAIIFEKQSNGKIARRIALQGSIQVGTPHKICDDISIEKKFVDLYKLSRTPPNTQRDDQDANHNQDEDYDKIQMSDVN